MNIAQAKGFGISHDQPPRRELKAVRKKVSKCKAMTSLFNYGGNDQE